MTKQDVTKFAEIMAYLGTVFGKELTSVGLTAYFRTMADLSIEQIQRAALHLANNRTITGTFPLPAEFRQALDNLDGSVEERAELAWRTLLWSIENVGSYSSVAWDDPHIADTVHALGGWLRVCSADGNLANDEWLTKNLTWRHKEFIQMYARCAEREPVLMYLPGLAELENRDTYPDAVPPIKRVTGKLGQYRITHQQQLPGAESKLLPIPDLLLKEVSYDKTGMD